MYTKFNLNFSLYTNFVRSTCYKYLCVYYNQIEQSFSLSYYTSRNKHNVTNVVILATRFIRTS